MKAYYIINKKNNVVAFHEDETVIERFMNNLESRDKSGLTVVHGKLKKKELPQLSDMYLIPYRKTYIQERYIDTMNILEDGGRLEDLVFTKEMLSTIYNELIESGDKTKAKKINSAINVLYDLISDIEFCTPDSSSLENAKLQFESFASNQF